MSHDRRLVDTIKEHFARKTSDQLRELLEGNDAERWSAEAFVAAREVLDDRSVGRAEEPVVAEEELASNPDDLAKRVALTIAALSLPLGWVVVPAILAREKDTIAKDLPMPFGPGMAWLAVNSTDTAAVIAALDLSETREATWDEGLRAAQQGAVYVTPPVGDWTLVVCTALWEHAQSVVRPLLVRLSQQFGEAQYFCTRGEAGLHSWALARGGRLVRGYAGFPQKSVTLWDEGAPTPEERELGLRFGDAPSAGDGALPDEDCVLQLAARWSIDPTTLDAQYKEPVLGLVGGVATAVRSGRQG